MILDEGEQIILEVKGRFHRSFIVTCILFFLLFFVLYPLVGVLIVGLYIYFHLKRSYIVTNKRLYIEYVTENINVPFAKIESIKLTWTGLHLTLTGGENIHINDPSLTKDDLKKLSQRIPVNVK